VFAWQETVVGPEIGGLRLTEVLVNVGDTVRRGQVLARLSGDTVRAELAQTRASLAEAQATLADAQANAERARKLQTTGAISAQQINQYLTLAQTARARVDAQRARLQADELRLTQTRVLAPDDGVISARTATVGAVVQAGQELFKLIRGGRLEWRAEVTAADLSRLAPGMNASLTAADGSIVAGRVRMVAPTIDPQTRNGIVFVDLPRGGSARAGMFARGEFEIGHSPALTLPQSAVLLRDGFSYVFRVGEDSRVTETRITTGRRVGDRIEVLGGLEPSARVVASGTGFLGDGDLVRVIDVNGAPLRSADTAGEARPAR
jgi:RND family efflux transporter MFP subunit